MAGRRASNARGCFAAEIDIADRRWILISSSSSSDCSQFVPRFISDSPLLPRADPNGSSRLRANSSSIFRLMSLSGVFLSLIVLWSYGFLLDEYFEVAKIELEYLCAIPMTVNMSFGSFNLLEATGYSLDLIFDYI